MLDSLAEIKGKSFSAMTILKNVQTAPTDLAEPIAELEKLQVTLDRIASMDAQKARELLAKSRSQLYRVSQRLDEFQGEMAERYRQAIGDRKDWFEALSPTQQQAQEPVTFICKQNYELITTAGDLVIQVNGALLEVEDELEDEQLQRLSATATDTGVSPNLGEGSAFISKGNQDDPAQPTLSP